MGCDRIYSGKERTKRKTIWAGGVLLWTLCFFCLFMKSDSYAADKRLVKVAFFPMDGYHVTNADGSLGGMDVEYLEALTEYTDWNVEYVECDSWEEALRLLEEKKVDLVGSAQYSEERAKVYRYAALPSGYTFGVIATNPEASIAYEDFIAMRQITFGMVKGYVRRDEFLQYLSAHGIDSPKIKEYGTTAQLQDALAKGEINALVHTFTEVKEGQRLIGRFAPRPFYYITYRENEELMRELDAALADLKMSSPELETKLMNRFYYGKFDKSALLTTEEHIYISEKQKITVGYLDGFYPFSYEEDGAMKGLTRELLEDSVASAGLELEFRKLPDRIAAREALQSGEIDVSAYCTDTQSILSGCGLTAACDYADVPLVLMMKKNRSVSDVMTLATISSFNDKLGMAVQKDEEEIVNYDTQRDCVDAVESGAADAVFCDGYLAEYLLRTEVGYADLQIKNVFNSELSLSMAVREEDAQLSGILEKTVFPIDSKTINAYMLKENEYPLVSMLDFVRNNSLWIIPCMFALIVLVILIAAHMIRDSRKIQKLMYKDAQMDIWNLNYLIFKGEHDLLTERRNAYAVIDVNLVGFRRYTTINGWNVSERLLEGVARILLNRGDGETEICARNQGDRFVLLWRYTDRDQLMERLYALKDEIESWIFDDTSGHMQAQMGIYYVPQEEIDLRLAINYANQALELAGDSRENALKVYDDALEEQIRERYEHEKLLESADIHKDFVVYYQPKADIRDDSIVGAEALVRFRDPTDGGRIKAPGFFVPYYEQTGRITEIDFFVLEESCRMLRRRLDAGLPVVGISCNFSRLHFIRPGFAERFLKALDRYQISRELIEIEITETLVVEQLHQGTVKKTLDELKEKGVRLSLDDFGSGYSSLGVFEQIPASVIKLDRSFLLNQEDRGRQVKIMRSIVTLAKELGAQVVCEGVETEADVALMREIGAHVAQGYFYSKPVPEAEFEEKLAGK
ncbi:MAG: EAL domain-containing protein [Lachnospiraceae bacterium]|nr:EAL domain-containing protein [Lachnospiraceae bacterium]